MSLIPRQLFVALNTPLLIERLEPTLIPPRVEAEAVGKLYAFAPLAMPSNFFLSAADIRPCAD